MLFAIPAYTYGPYPARLVSVHDGDTIKVDVQVWPGQTNRVSVRLDGVDTPELRGKCPQERVQAIKARDYVIAMTKDKSLAIQAVTLGKYAGRVVARVLVDGQDLTDMLIAAGLGRPYDGGKRQGWCGE